MLNLFKLKKYILDFVKEEPPNIYRRGRTYIYQSFSLYEVVGLSDVNHTQS